MGVSEFEWDPRKNEANIVKHGVSFHEAQKAFLDPKRVIAEDLKHSRIERRYFCFGKIEGFVMTVCFTYKKDTIRIISAGYWRQGRKVYEKAQN